jgi:hypothetical protein
MKMKMKMKNIYCAVIKVGIFNNFSSGHTSHLGQFGSGFGSGSGFDPEHTLP